MRLRRWRMWFGFIICYESSTWAFADTGGKSHKICEFWRSFLGRPLGRHFGAFLAPFWLRFGIILEPKWPKKAIPKSTRKKGPEKVMRLSASVCGCWGCCTLKNHPIGQPGDHLTPYSHSTRCLGGTVADFDFWCV